MKPASAGQIAFIVLAAILTAGCLGQTPATAPSPSPSPAAFPSFLLPVPSVESQPPTPEEDAITENLLQALSAKNYTQFTANFSLRFKVNFTEGVFSSLAGIVQQTSGKYVSKQPASFYGSEGGFEAYSYLAEFETGAVNTTIVFNSYTSEVDAVVFDSPTLRIVQAAEQTQKNGGTLNTT